MTSPQSVGDYSLTSGGEKSTRGSLLLLEDDSNDGDCHANADSREHAKCHFETLMFHFVQVVHVLRMEIIWFRSMAMATPHALCSC